MNVYAAKHAHIYNVAEWEAMKDQLFQHMQNIRKEFRRATFMRRQVDFEILFKKLFQNLSYETQLIIGSEVTLRVPSIARLLNPDGKWFDYDPQDLKIALRDALPDYLATRHHHNTEAFKQLLRDELDLPAPSSVDPLQLAVAMWFPCRSLDSANHDQAALTLLTADEVIQEKQTIPFLLRYEPVSESQWLTEEVLDYIQSPVFAFLALSLCTDKWPRGADVKDVAAIIKLCGKDPRTATVQDMDDAERDNETRLVCTAHEEVAPVMGWRTAVRSTVSHAYDVLFQSPPLTLNDSDSWDSQLYHLWVYHDESRSEEGHPSLSMRRATTKEIDAAKPLEQTISTLR